MNARFGFLLAAISASLLVACGGGGGGGGGTPPTSPPTTVPTATPGNVALTFGAQPSSTAIPAGAGVSGTIALPAGSGTAVLTASPTKPSGTATVQATRRTSAAAGNNAVAYFTLTAQGGTVTLQGLPGFTATLPSTAPSGTYFVAYWDASGQQPAWVSTTQTGSSGAAGGTITVPATTSPAVTIANGHAVYLAVYYGGYIPPINIYGCVGVTPPPAITAGESRALVGVHPITSGDAYTYSGTLAQTIVRSQPCPQPTATANANVTITVAMSPGPNGASIENSTETDAYATNTTTLNTAANVSDTGGKYFESSETATDGNGNTIATTYGGSGLQYAEDTQSQGATWSNAPPATVNQTLADSTTLNRTYASDGSYVETDAIPMSGSNTITVKSDGSGSYVIDGGTSAATTVTMSAPVSGVITVKIGTQTLSVNSWLPSPLKLYGDATTDLGSVSSVPAGCSTAVTSGPVEHIQRKVQTVDPVLGYLENETVDSYELPNPPGTSATALGPVCETIADTLTQYYDYSWTTPYALFFSAKPMIVNTISETVSLQASGLVDAGVTRRNTQAVHAQLLAREAAISFTRSLQRSQQVQALQHAAAAHFSGGIL